MQPIFGAGAGIATFKADPLHSGMRTRDHGLYAAWTRGPSPLQKDIGHSVLECGPPRWLHKGDFTSHQSEVLGSPPSCRLRHTGLGALNTPPFAHEFVPLTSPSPYYVPIPTIECKPTGSDIITALSRA